MFAPKSSYAAVVSIAFSQRERGRRHTKRELRENNGIVTEMHLRTGAGGRCGAGTLWKIRPKTERVFASRACSTSLHHKLSVPPFQHVPKYSKRYYEIYYQPLHSPSTDKRCLMIRKCESTYPQ